MSADWLSLERFDYARVFERWADLRLLALLPEAGGPQPRALHAPTLLVHNGRRVVVHGASDAFTERRTPSGLLWQVSFAVPLEVVEYPDALFRLGMAGGVLVALPTPSVRRCEPRTGPGRGSLYRRMIALTTAAAVATATTPALGLAAVLHRARHRAHHADPRTATPLVLETATLTPAPPMAGATPALRHHHRHRLHHVSGPPGVSAPHRRRPAAARPAPGSALTLSITTARPKRKRPHRHVDVGQPAPPEQSITPSPPAGLADPDDLQISQLTSQPPASATAIWSDSLSSNPKLAAIIRQLLQTMSVGDQPPRFLIPIYKAAGKRYHIPWQILAAINAIETNYGRDLRTSSAGAIGWMQFMPGTWHQYGMAIDTRGDPNPYDPTDAIFSAARYLAANGGARDLRRAIFAYNHATWYVDEVLWRAQMIVDHGFDNRHKQGYTLPLDARFMHPLGRTDDGVDLEMAPDGAFVYSITPGIVTAVASDPSGFGPDYPVVLVTKGPLAGQYIYYGHVAASLVHVGQHVAAGQPIALMGHTGDAASLGHGHIEIGFSDASGDPLNHHGAGAWTPSGDAMRQFLIALAHAYGIKDS